MLRWFIVLLIAVAVAVIGQLTQWFGFVQPTIDKVRVEANARIDATNAKAAANAALIEATERKAAALDDTSKAQTKQIDAVDKRVTQGAKDATNAHRATDADIAKLSARVDANAQAITEMKANAAAGGGRTAEELQLDRDLTNAMVMASQLKAEVAEAVQTEGRAPTSNAQAGIAAAERYADGALTRLAIEQGAVVAYFKTANPNPNPRFRLVPVIPAADSIGIIRWKCETNMPAASRLFATCQLKPSL